MFITLPAHNKHSVKYIFLKNEYDKRKPECQQVSLGKKCKSPFGNTM